MHLPELLDWGIEENIFTFSAWLSDFVFSGVTFLFTTKFLLTRSVDLGTVPHGSVSETFGTSLVLFVMGSSYNNVHIFVSIKIPPNSLTKVSFLASIVIVMAIRISRYILVRPWAKITARIRAWVSIRVTLGKTFVLSRFGVFFDSSFRRRVLTVLGLLDAFLSIDWLVI